MSEEKFTAQNLIETRIKMSLECRFDTGPLMGKFLRGLRDEKRIWATRCSACGRTMLPPARVCAECNVEAGGWLELKDEGYLMSYDVIVVPTLNPRTGEMRKVPYSVGRIVLDGGDALMWHFLDETDASRLALGKRCKAVWEEERTGRITDIKFFHVLDEFQPGFK